MKALQTLVRWVAALAILAVTGMSIYHLFGTPLQNFGTSEYILSLMSLWVVMVSASASLERG